MDKNDGAYQKQARVLRAAKELGLSIDILEMPSSSQ